MAEYQYDLMVIGSGPGGVRAAIQAAKLGKRVALLEYGFGLGGVWINYGTVPSKTMREAAMHLSGYREKAIYGAAYKVKKNITMEDLLGRAEYVMRNERDVLRHQLERNGIEPIPAKGSFYKDAHTIQLDFGPEHGKRRMTAAKVILAVGTHAFVPPNVPVDGRRIFTSDQLLNLDYLPKSLTVIGGGVIGCEYATIFAILGVRVTLVDKRTSLLGFIDREIVDTLTYHMRRNRITLRLGEEVDSVEPFEDEEKGERVRTHLKSGKQIVTEKVLTCSGRQGNTAELNLEAAGLEADKRGRVAVDDNYQTANEDVYAVGDVIGFPGLASTSLEQGRAAACHALGYEIPSIREIFPLGIYTVPEISTVGRNEEELTEAGVPYEVGKASFDENARGQIVGDFTGLLKLIFHLETREILGVHVIGENAAELVHVGQAVLAHGGKVDYFIDTVFNYPTLGESYKVAALDGVNRLG